MFLAAYSAFPQRFKLNCATQEISKEASLPTTALLSCLVTTLSATVSYPPTPLFKQQHSHVLSLAQCTWPQHCS